MSKQDRPHVLKSRLLARSWRVVFYEDTLQYGNSSIASYARIRVPDFALALAARDKDGKIPLVRQYRHGAGHDFWELPAGLIERKERPEDCVRREFEEEVGYELLHPRLVTSFYPSPARSSQIAYVFSGRVGRRATEHLDATEALNVRFVSKALALRLLSKRISASHLLAYLFLFRAKL